MKVEDGGGSEEEGKARRETRVVRQDSCEATATKLLRLPFLVAIPSTEIDVVRGERSSRTDSKMQDYGSRRRRGRRKEDR